MGRGKRPLDWGAVKDCAVFTLGMAAAVWAECPPVCAALVVAVLVLSLWPARSKGRYYRVCPYCGANLDPGEVCDCPKENRPGAVSTEAVAIPFHAYCISAGGGCQA